MLDPDWPGWISIHAPHEGERHIPTSRGFCRFFISIHAPHEGERRGTPTQSGCCLPFQSTLPTRGSDGRYAFAPFAIPHISIHAPHEGERHGCRKPSRISCIFQSTLPTRGSDQKRLYMILISIYYISIHAPHEGERHRKSAVKGKSADHGGRRTTHKGERHALF